MIVWLPYHDRGWHVRSVDTNTMIAGQKIFKPWGETGYLYYMEAQYTIDASIQNNTLGIMRTGGIQQEC